MKFKSAIESHKKVPESVPHKGFSLIITITMMVLLSLVAVGLLSLSSVTLRSSSSSIAQAEARSNARMAAIMAIAQLQEMTGLDTRITASAKLVDEDNVEATGVWRSWEGTDNDGSGKAEAPDYRSKNEAGDPSESLGSQGSGRFLGWLTSTSVGEEIDAEEVPGSSTEQSSGQIKMVSTGTLDTADEVYLEPTIITSEDDEESGAFSWWTTGDNSKALVNANAPESATSESDWQQRLRGNRLPDPEVFGLEELDELTTEETIIPSRRSLELLPNSTLTGDEFYDLTTFSRGLLTNVATGGWRKDLSLFSENYDDLPTSDLRLFSHEPGDSLTFNQATPGSRPSNALMYHWADYSGNSGNPAWQQLPPVSSWSALVDYMKTYEDLRSSSPNSVDMDVTTARITNRGTSARYELHDQTRIGPQVSRIQWVLSIGSMSNGRFSVIPGIVLTPIVTLWNPYNVSLDTSDFTIEFDQVFPLKITYRINNITYDQVPLRDIAENNINLRFPNSISLEPGESRVFGVTSTGIAVNTGNQDVFLSEGYRPRGGVIFTNLGENDEGEREPITNALSSSTFEIQNVQFSADGLEGADRGAVDGIGARFRADNATSTSAQIIVLTFEKSELGGQSGVDELYGDPAPDAANPISAPLGQIGGDGSIPFTTATLGLRAVSPPPERFSNLQTRGLLQSNPLQYYAEVGLANQGGSTSTDVSASGGLHPINSPYDFVISSASGWNDPAVTVDFDPSTNSGYIVSGNGTADGLTRCILAELPTRPLQSLADLQHLDVRNNNILPPYQFNIIGNASAHPLFEPDEVSNPTPGFYADLSNDDSYLLNHILFDDWFLSSIAPDPSNFSSRIDRTATTVFEELVDGEETLPNHFYLASSLADEAQSSDITSASPDSDTGLYPFETIASLLEVEGMFNINSVSVDAWRAVLSRNREVEVPYFSSNGSVETEQSEFPAYPRTTVASDVSSNSSSVIRGANAFSATVGGYAAFTSDEIEALAEQIVEEVRERGPFLSLAEFVNRRLTTDTELALAGTIQQALDDLAAGRGSANPYSALQAAGRNVSALTIGNTAYKFPEAAEGSSLFGVPGWARQADILRPLAPIMSARDDTFTIRAYGDSRGPSGSIVSQAWCELVVQRNANYVDNADAPEIVPLSSDMTSEVNRRFGRRYQVLSFRWLHEDEV